MNFHHLLGPEAVRVNKCCWLVLWFARGPPRTRRNLQAVLSLGIRKLSFRNCEISIGVGLVGGCRWLFFFGGGVRREGGWQFLSCWIIFNLWVKKILRLCGLIVVFCFFLFPSLWNPWIFYIAIHADKKTYLWNGITICWSTVPTSCYMAAGVRWSPVHQIPFLNVTKLLLLVVGCFRRCAECMDYLPTFRWNMATFKGKCW